MKKKKSQFKIRLQNNSESVGCMTYVSIGLIALALYALWPVEAEKIERPKPEVYYAKDNKPLPFLKQDTLAPVIPVVPYIAQDTITSPHSFIVSYDFYFEFYPQTPNCNLQINSEKKHLLTINKNGIISFIQGFSSVDSTTYLPTDTVSYKYQSGENENFTTIIFDGIMFKRKKYK